jgi:hypothetical protein
MSHHYSGPDFGFPQGDARLDFTDLYAFRKPGETGKSILIVNVHPSAGEPPLGLPRRSLSHPKHCTSSRLIPMVMRLPVSPTECASPLSSAAHKSRVSVALMARKRPVPAMAGG